MPYVSGGVSADTDDTLPYKRREPHHHSKGCISSIANFYITTPKNKGEVVPAFAKLSHF